MIVKSDAITKTTTKHRKKPGFSIRGYVHFFIFIIIFIFIFIFLCSDTQTNIQNELSVLANELSVLENELSHAQLYFVLCLLFAICMYVCSLLEGVHRCI